MPIPITMPRLSDTMEAGTIIKWNVKEGDKVSAGDVIADVETDKATMEMAVYDDGTIAKLMVPEGKSVGIGTTIAVLAGEGEDVKQAAAGAGDGDTGAKAKSKPRDQARPDAKATATTTASRPAAEKMTEDDAAQPQPAHSAADPEGRQAPESRQRDTVTDSSQPSSDQLEPQHEVERVGDGRLRISPVARRV